MATDEPLTSPTDSVVTEPGPVIPPGKETFDYNEQLKHDFGHLIDILEVSILQKEFLKRRWLDQVLWIEGRASKARDRYYQLRMISIVGGVLVPVLIGLTPVDGSREGPFFRYGAAGLGACVATALAIEQFFNYGDRWRHYRRSAELLKSQGWQFFQLSGPIYSKAKSHSEAFATFAGQVEDIIQRDVEVYATQVTEERPQEKRDDSEGKPSA